MWVAVLIWQLDVLVHLITSKLVPGQTCPVSNSLLANWLKTRKVFQFYSGRALFGVCLLPSLLLHLCRPPRPSFYHLESLLMFTSTLPKVAPTPRSQKEYVLPSFSLHWNFTLRMGGLFMLMRPIYRNSKLNLCVVTSDPLNVKLPSVTLPPDLNRCSLSVSLVLPRLLQSKCVFSRSQGGMFNIQAKNVQHPMFNIWALSKVKESKHMHLGHVG